MTLKELFEELERVLPYDINFHLPTDLQNIDVTIQCDVEEKFDIDADISPSYFDIAEVEYDPNVPCLTIKTE